MHTSWSYPWAGLLLLLLTHSCTSESGLQELAVTAVYPSADTLPENILRMYVHFSKPMKATGNLENIQVLDERGRVVEGALFNNVYELWDAGQQQLTLLFDPARVKTGLRAHLRRGRALQAERAYQLRIGALEDVDGNTTPPFVKSFWVGPADVQAPDTARWEVVVPAVHSRVPLVLRFPQSLDAFSLRQRLVLTDAEQQPVEGVLRLGPEVKAWYFRPLRPWGAGHYSLYINTRLEDPAGNNINGRFDHEVGSLRWEEEGRVIRMPIEMGD